MMNDVDTTNIRTLLTMSIGNEKKYGMAEPHHILCRFRTIADRHAVP